MGDILVFPHRRVSNEGTIHVTKHWDYGYEIAHESSSGNSWGSFEQFKFAQDAVDAAYRLNREQYGNVCDVFIAPAVSGSLPQTPFVPRDRTDF